MTLSLEIESDGRPLTTLDGLRLELKAHNLGPESVLLPVVEDESAALTIYTYRDERLIRVANGVTQATLMRPGPLDDTPHFEPLSAGATRTWSMDLTQFQYPLPVGENSVYAECQLADGSLVRSNTLLVPVTEAKVAAVSLTRANPVLDGVCALIEVAGEAGPRWWSRLYTTGRPIVPWCSAEMPVPEGALAVLAQPGFYSLESFAPFFERWLVTQNGEALRALKLVEGVATEEVREAQAASNTRLLSAIGLEGGRLLLCLQRGEGSLFCAELSTRGIEPRFELPTPRAADLPIVIDARHDRIVLLGAASGVERIDVDYNGALIAREQLFNSDLRACELRFDPVDDTVKAAFWDGPSGEHLQLVAIRGAEPRVLYRERSASLREILELGWDVAARGRFHVLANTADGLYYWSDHGVPQLLVPGGQARRPRVIADPSPFIGFADLASGYNFYEYRAGQLLFREGTLR